MIENLLTEDQKKLRDEVRAFVRDDVPRQLILDMDADKVRYPREFVEAVAKRRLMGLRFAEEYGGRGLGFRDEMVAVAEVGVLGALACLYSLSIIVGEALNVFGTPDQKERWLRPTIEGKLMVAVALTEPRGGSDVFGATTTAIRDGDSYVLNGEKRFVVGAEGADYFLVYARSDPDAPSHEGLTAFVVERCPEVEVQHVYGLMGARGGGTGRVYFRDVRVPAENVIGREKGGAMVFYQSMVPERMTSAAGSVGGARAALEIAARYSNRRRAFGKKIRAFQAVSFMVADSITMLDAAQALVYAAAHSVDSGDEPNRARRLVSEAKKFATEAAWEVINKAMQIMGGIGYTNVYPIERLLRDGRLALIWTGTSEIMSLIIQHEYYRELGMDRRARDVEADAPDADLTDEKVYG
jgi:alkylation response protein AidB-like acyl-CoA dehydrogenase